VLDALNSERFADVAPAEVHATLLDEGVYLCSVSTMYRLLHDHSEVKDRRNQLRHPNYAKPELLATGPNQLWSWDITKLKGPEKWNTFHLYVIIDVFSRYVVGWMVAERESATLARKLIAESMGKQELSREQLENLGLHADRGTSMRSKLVAQLLADLGVTKTHSRPYTSNDNPFSESQFKTMKYRPEFPERFGSIEDALAFCRVFFPWYNDEHRHSGIAHLTPRQVHYGLPAEILSERQRALDMAYEAHPERFSKRPIVPSLHKEVWINPPSSTREAT
jgi:putative transposase